MTHLPKSRKGTNCPRNIAVRLLGGGNTRGLGFCPWEGPLSILPSYVGEEAQRGPDTGHQKAVRAEQPSWWLEGLPIPTSLVWDSRHLFPLMCPFSPPQGHGWAGTWGPRDQV